MYLVTLHHCHQVNPHLCVIRDSVHLFTLYMLVQFLRIQACDIIMSEYVRSNVHIHVLCL